MEILRTERLFINGGVIPINLSKDKELYVIDIDGVEWVRTTNQMHSIVLFEMMHENITDYVHYEKK